MSLIHSSLDRADRRGARLEVSTVIFLHLGRLWTASHNPSRPVHSRMLSRFIFCGLPRFLPPVTMPCSIFWQVYCVRLYDRTIGVFGVLLSPEAVLEVLRLRWWLALLVYLLCGLYKKLSGSFWTISSQMPLFLFRTRFSGSSFRIRMSALTQPGLYRVMSLSPFWSRPQRRWSTRGTWMMLLLRGVPHTLI